MLLLDDSDDRLLDDSELPLLELLLLELLSSDVDDDELDDDPELMDVDDSLLVDVLDDDDD